MIEQIEKINNYIEENFPDENILLAEGFESAFIGVVESHGAAPKALYDYESCLDILKGMQEMDEGEAIEYMEFNVMSAYVGESTPAFIKLDFYKF